MIRKISYLILLLLSQNLLASNSNTPEAYIQFEQYTQSLLKPLVSLMEDGKATLPIEGMASDHGIKADKLESYTRPSLLAAIWLQTTPTSSEKDQIKLDREKVAKWLREGLVAGTNPESSEYWGQLTNYHQHGVEMAILTMSLEIGQEWIWDPLSQAEKDQVAEWMSWMRGSARYWNNHMFFSVLVLEFLGNHGYGIPQDEGHLDHLFHNLERMHDQDGWFMDGMNLSHDHYNAYAFHTYGQWWSYKYGHKNPERAERWLNWANKFIKDYTHFYAESGEHLAYGRSITYRFNGLGVFGLAALNELDSVPLGEMRRICRKNLEFFMSQPIQQSQGCLSIGWLNEFPMMAESYTCAGSPYWASKGLMMMTIPPEHPFWTEEEQAYPAEKGDFVHIINGPQFILRSIEGEVELLNGASYISRGNAKRYGAYKWGKMSYRTGIGFEVSPDTALYPADSALTTQSHNEERIYGRHTTFPVHVGEDYLEYIYSLGLKDDPYIVQVDTSVFWNKGWLLNINRINCPEEKVYTQGGFSLGNDINDFETQSEGLYVKSMANDMTSVIQGLYGFEKSSWDERLDESVVRKNILYKFHKTPVLITPKQSAKDMITIALTWTGKDSAESQAWTLKHSEAGKLILSHPVLEDWTIEHPSLQKID